MNRDNSLDAVGGLLIAYMIYGHICLWCGVKHIEILARIFFFFMPWFFFKSGMFFKSEKICDLFSKGWRRLMIPYMVFSLLGQVVFSVMWLLGGNTPLKHYIIAPLRTLLHEGAVVGNSPLWFLLSLFVVRILFGLVSSNKKVLYCGVLISLALAFVLNALSLHDYFYISNISLGFFFFGCGYLMRNSQYTMPYLIAGIIFYISYVIGGSVGFDFRSNGIETSNYLFCMVASLGGILTINNASKRFKCIGNWLVYIGKNSMTYYVAHWVVLGLSSILFRNMVGLSDGYTLFVAYVLANVTLLPLIDIVSTKKIKWILGK